MRLIVTADFTHTDDSGATLFTKGNIIEDEALVKELRDHPSVVATADAALPETAA